MSPDGRPRTTCPEALQGPLHDGQAKYWVHERLPILADSVKPKAKPTTSEDDQKTGTSLSPKPQINVMFFSSTERRILAPKGVANTKHSRDFWWYA